MAFSATQQAGWMFTAANAVFALASCGATYLAIEPKAGPFVGIIGAAFVLMVSGAGRAAGSFYGNRKWFAGTIFFLILAATAMIDYKTNDMGLSEVALKSETSRKAANSEITAAKDAINFANAEIERLKGFKKRVNSPDEEVVKQAQIDLADMGLYKGPIDGDKGGGTQAAMTEWSEINNYVGALAEHASVIAEMTPIAAREPNDEASFFTVKMAALLAIVISAGSLACSFIGGILCTDGAKASELEQIEAAREALVHEREEADKRKALEAEKTEKLRAVIQTRRDALLKRVAS